MVDIFNNLRDKQILITGNCGQIGRFLVRRLAKLDFEIFGLDKEACINLHNIPFLKANLIHKTDLEEHKSILKNIDILVHLAGKVEGSRNVIKDAIGSIDLNIQGILNLLEYLPNIRYLCFASTYMVYGLPQSNPVNEVHPTNPFNIYGVSKLVAEKFLQMYARERDISLTVLRFMGVYGPETEDTGRAIVTFIKQIALDQRPVLFGSGGARRNHVYIDDVVDAILTALRTGKTGIFNIGGEKAPSNLELVTLINDIMGKNLKPVFKEEKEYDFITDISRACGELGFTPRVELKEGLTAEIEDWLRRGICQ